MPKHLKAAAGPSPDLGGDDFEADFELLSIPMINQVRDFFYSSRSSSEVSKYRDPLHLLLDYIAGVSTTSLVSCPYCL